jgi:hypothetical protein
MPYIDKISKEKLNNGFSISTAGELNYSFTKLAIDYLNTMGECYQTYNDIIGALEGAKLELYRRKVISYEDKKIIENGDVY